MNRRTFIKDSSLAAAAAAAMGARIALADQAVASEGLKGHVNHSVCKWCYPGIPLETLCEAATRIGLRSIEILRPTDFATLQKYGLTCGMVANPVVPGPEGKKVGGISNAWNRVENHDALVAAYEHDMPLLAAAGINNFICFSGNRDGMDDEEGLQNCAAGIKRLMRTTERHNVVVAMELLNSKVDHKDYMADHTTWGAELCKAVGSDNFKLLYDIYHMQIMEGDVIATIRDNRDHFAHYHTGGVPGRNEIDDTQELNYPAIMKAIVDTGFDGFVAQEFIPSRDPLTSLEQAVQICDI
jgi:hydroxypyruvate isomerase